MSNLKITKKCEFCDTEFATIRPTAKFCCNSCRTKANVKRRENEKNEKQKAEKQAAIEEYKRAAAEARKFKKAEKEAKLNEAKRLAEIEIEIQAEIDAFELSAKKRGINYILEHLRANLEAREKRHQEEDRCKQEERKIAADKKKRDAMIRAEMIGKGLTELFFSLSNPKNKSENTLTNPHLHRPSPLLNKLGGSLQTKAPILKTNKSKLVTQATTEGINGLSNSANENIKPPMKLAIPTNPVHKSIAENILDMTKIF